MTYHVIPEGADDERNAMPVSRDDLAIDQHHSNEMTARASAANLTDRGYFVRVWRNLDGRWWHVQAIDLHVRSQREEACAHVAEYGAHAWTNDLDYAMHCVECGLVVKDSRQLGAI